MEVEKSKIILVEGKDDKSFLGNFLNRLGITDVQIITVDGKENFGNSIELLKQKTFNFEKVSIISVIRDADENSQSAFQSVSYHLEKNNLKPPSKINTFNVDSTPRCGIYIISKEDKTGMLEDLCLESVKNLPIFECINKYIECLNEKLSEKPKNIAKTKVQIFLASKPEIANTIGIGMEKGYWNLEADSMKKLSEFLQNYKN